MNAASARDPDLTRARILEAANALFVEKGYAAVAMREVAQRSGMTKSLIHHHFGGKEGLWEAVKEQAFADYYRAQAEDLHRGEVPVREFLVAAVRRYFEFLRDNPQVVRLFTWAHLQGDNSCSERDGQLVGLGAQRVRAAQQAGALRDDINPTHVVTIFVSLCTQWFEAREHHCQWPGMGSDEEFLEDFLKVFMEGLLPRPQLS